MGSLIGEERHLANGSTSFLTPSPKCKRRKVSAVRDFPCGLNTSEFDERAAKRITRASMSDDSSSKSIKRREKSSDISEAEKGFIVQGLMCASSCPWSQVQGQAKFSRSQGKKHGYDAQDHEKCYLTRSKGKAEKLEEKFMLIAPCPKKMKSDGVSSNNIDLREKSSDITQDNNGVIVQGLMCAPTFTWRQVKGTAELSPSRDCAKVSKGKKHGYDAQYSQKRYLTRSKGNEETLREKSMLTGEFSRSLTLRDDEDRSEKHDVEPLPGPHHCASIPPYVPCSPVVMERDKKFEDESEIRIFSDRLKNPNMDFLKDKDEKVKSKSESALANSIELQGKSSDIILVEKGVIVQGLMCASSSPWRQVEKPVKLISSHISATAINGKKHDGDVQDNQNRYLTRSKGDLEKMTEKSMLIAPCLKELEAGKLSRSLAPKDHEDYSADEERDFELLPGQHNSDVSVPSFVACSSEVTEREKKFEDESEIRSSTERLKNPFLDIVKYKHEKIKSKSDGASSNSIVLQEKSNDITDVENGVIEQGLMCASSDPWRQVERPAKLTANHASARVSNEKKHDYDAQDDQKRYLTRSKSNAEKMARKSLSIPPSPKDLETGKLSRSLACRDNEDYSEDVERDIEFLPGRRHSDVSIRPFAACSSEVTEQEKKFEDQSESNNYQNWLKNLIVNFVKDKDKKTNSKSDGASSNSIELQEKSGDITEVEKRVIVQGMSASSYPGRQVERPTKLNPSCVSARVSNEKKNDSDAQDNQKRYLTRSKSNSEMMDKDEKINSKSDGASNNSIELQEKSGDIAEVEKGVIEQGMSASSSPGRQVERPTKLSPSRVSARVSNEKKNDSDAQDNQKRYLTRSKSNSEMMDKDEKINSKSDGASNHSIELQEKSGDITEVEKGVIEQGMSASSSPGRQVERPTKLSPSRVSARVSNEKKHDYDAKINQEHYLTRSKNNTEKMTRKSILRAPSPKELETGKLSWSLARKVDDDYLEDERRDCEHLPGPRNCDVSVPPFVACSSSGRGARTKVRATLRLFQALVRKILQEEETNLDDLGTSKTAYICAANVMKEQGKYINTEKVVGTVPGVEIGDIFSCRLELAIIGIHTPLQNDIDTVKKGNTYIATSVVASGGYDNGEDYSDVLIYTDQGENPMGVDKKAEDQKLERGNLALKNCIDEKIPVRVIRGLKEAKPSDNGDGRAKMIAAYTYDGLYTVKRYWYELGPHGNWVYKFELIRILGQHQLSWKEVKHSNKCKIREGCCVDDISKGREKLPICAVNTIDDEKPPLFTYITGTMYSDWCRPLPPKGCNCKGRCSDSNRCACVKKNGGEIPYNLSGAIVQAKSLVYECGPSCKCPPTCPNRVSQHGIKLPLEIFKTKSMGWGVRCRSPIPSGSFICEYIGELLDDKEAEQRIGSDEYLFDIGQNYNDTSLSDGLPDLMPHMPSTDSNAIEDVGFTIDAARYGNIGRFVNHSCSPNLYAQDVLYDHEDERIPHVMLFAAENIPPLQELTYHYNYTIDQVFDSKGNIKKKNCYCGSVECTGRLY